MWIALPAVTSRRVTDIPSALRATRTSRSYFVPACLLTLTSHDTVGWVTITLVWLGHVAVTGAELYLAVGAWRSSRT